jgi:hypothetical protein
MWGGHGQLENVHTNFFRADVEAGSTDHDYGNNDCGHWEDAGAECFSNPAVDVTFQALAAGGGVNEEVAVLVGGEKRECGRYCEDTVSIARPIFKDEDFAMPGGRPPPPPPPHARPPPAPRPSFAHPSGQGSSPYRALPRLPPSLSAARSRIACLLRPCTTALSPFAQIRTSVGGSIPFTLSAKYNTPYIDEVVFYDDAAGAVTTGGIVQVRKTPSWPRS